MPAYRELVERAIAAHDRSADLQVQSRQLAALAHVLREGHAGRVLLRRCAWCGRFDIGGEWLYLDAVGSGQQRIVASLRVNATHGICPACFERAQTEAAAARERRPR